MTVTILAIVAIIVVAAIVLKSRNRTQCPKLILGYSYCNRWNNQECDHSPEAVLSAKRAMNESKPTRDRLPTRGAKRPAKSAKPSRSKVRNAN